MTSRAVCARVAKPFKQQISNVMNDFFQALASLTSLQLVVLYIGFQRHSPQDTSHTRFCTASNTCTPPHESYSHAENCVAIPEGKFISIVISRALALM
jgi:hypothetical protein